MSRRARCQRFIDEFNEDARRRYTIPVPAAEIITAGLEYDPTEDAVVFEQTLALADHDGRRVFRLRVELVPAQHLVLGGVPAELGWGAVLYRGEAEDEETLGRVVDLLLVPRADALERLRRAGLVEPAGET